jgi:hypothetical protein
MRVVPFGHVLVDGPQLEQPGFALTIEPENGEIKERYAKVCEIRANAASDWHDATPAEMRRRALQRLALVPIQSSQPANSAIRAISSTRG